MNLRQRSSLKGTLHLVDLAGSERLSRSNATGDRLKETVAINKSLSSLTDVFVSISNKSSHVRRTGSGTRRGCALPRGGDGGGPSNTAPLKRRFRFVGQYFCM